MPDRLVKRIRRSPRMEAWTMLAFAFAVIAAIGVSAWLSVRVTDEQAQQAHDRHSAIQANLRARYDDCSQENETRHALQLLAKQQLSSTAIRRLFPSLPESLIQQAERTKRFELQAFAARDCRRYANEAAP